VDFNYFLRCFTYMIIVIVYGTFSFIIILLLKQSRCLVFLKRRSCNKIIQGKGLMLTTCQIILLDMN